jgi:hypothetical protein
MTIFFSKSVGNFVDDTIWAKLPEDAVEVSYEDYRAFVEARNDGTKVVLGDESGKPYLADAPPPSPDDLAANIRRIRDQKLLDIQWRVDRYRAQADAGIPTNDSPQEYKRLLEYMQELRNIPRQSGFPREIVWPEEPA